jgi:pilus assembly protein CpaF
MNVVVPPVAFGGPVLTIRKAINTLLDYKSLVDIGTLTNKAVYFMNKAVDARQNIVITGGGGSGKTTILSILSSFIDGNQRVITVEDATEVTIQVKNFVRMELPQAARGEERLTMADLLRNALRMRPDRIIVGECRGVETIDMLMAMNTGHEGSMTTIHANNATDGLARMESMVVQSGVNVPLQLIQKNIGSTLQFVMHMERGPDGKRRLDEILEIHGWENGNYKLTPIFKWTPENGLLSTGAVPQFAVKSPVPGVKFPNPEDFFKPNTDIKFGDRK